MSANAEWNNYADWSHWIDSVNPSGDQSPNRRIIDGQLRLPYKSPNFPITGLQDTAHWKFGQFYANNGAVSIITDETGNDNTATILSTVPAELSELGLNSITKNGYARITENSSFQIDSNWTILSCWFKSSTTDYTAGNSLIVGYYSDQSNVEYGIIINTAGYIKAAYQSSGAIAYLSPIGGDVLIDTNWHTATIFISTTEIILVVDNNFAATGSGPAAETVSGTMNFTVGTFEPSTHLGFAGYMDEVYRAGNGSTSGFSIEYEQYRFEPHIYLSPVIDTFRSDSILTGILATLQEPSGSTVSFSLRASNTEFQQDNTSVQWTGFTSPGQVSSGVLADISDLGLISRGRFQQVRVRLTPSTDELKIETPTLSSLSIYTSVEDLVLSSARTAFARDPLTEIALFTGEKRIDKATIDLTVVTPARKNFIVGKNGVISFSAINFQDSKDEWIFQPLNTYGWNSNGSPISNTLQYESYTDWQDAVTNAPSLTYSLYFPESGVYNLWGYGYTSGLGLYWGFHSDTTNLRTLQLGIDDSGWESTPRWTNFGSVFVEEGGEYEFTVYAGAIQTVILDQWYFTNKDFLTELVDLGDEGYSAPKPISDGPFMTILRLRSLLNGEVEPISEVTEASIIVSSYLSSTKIFASGKLNYQIKNNISSHGVSFTNGLSLEFWQIGGGPHSFAAWNFS